MYQVIKRKGDDHWAQASVYANIGLTRIQQLIQQGNGTAFNSTLLLLIIIQEIVIQTII